MPCLFPEVDDLHPLQVKSIRLPREGGEGGRFKGFGYVEFETRSELIEALSKNDDVSTDWPIGGDNQTLTTLNLKYYVNCS